MCRRFKKGRSRWKLLFEIDPDQLRTCAMNLAEENYRIFDELLTLIAEMGRREAVLFQCSKFQYDDLVKDALELGADINATGPYGCPLHAAVWENDIKMCQLLCEMGADIHVRNKRGASPLDWCLDYYPDFAMVLLKYGRVTIFSFIATVFPHIFR